MLSCDVSVESVMRELHLACVQGISALEQLQILDVSNNQLTALAGVSSLGALQDVWLNDNQISDLEAVNTELNASRSSVTCIYLANNPGVRNSTAYKRSFLQWFPNLQQLDGDYVRGNP